MNSLYKHIRIYLLFLLLLSGFCSFSQDTKVCDEYIREGIEAMFNGEFIKAFDNLNKAQEIVDVTKWYKQQFLIYNNFGLIYYKMQNYTEAVNYYIKAYELSMSNDQLVDEMTVLNNIAVVYIKNHNHTQAKEYLYRSYQIAKKQNVNSRIAIYATNIAFLNYELNDYQEAQKYVDLVMSIPKEEIDLRTYMNFLIVKNILLLEKGYTKQVIDQCKDLVKECDENNFDEEKIELFVLLAEAYRKDNNWDQSFIVLDRALQFSNNYETKARVFESKSKTAIEASLFQEALSAKDSVIAYNKKISSTQNKELLENATLQFELSESKFALQANKINAENQKKFYLLSIISLFLTIVVLGVIFYKRNILAKQKRIIAENTLRIKNLELEREKNKLILLEKELKEKELLSDLKIKKQKEKEAALKREIEFKNKQLSDKILFQSTRNELLENIIEAITSKAEVKGNSTLLKIVKDLRNHLKEDSKWDDFSELFENVNNKFLKNIKQKHPNLNANDIRFLSFVYLNLNTKEIASLLNISPESCRKRKERLRHKLEIDRDVDLFEYLAVFS